MNLTRALCATLIALVGLCSLNCLADSPIAIVFPTGTYPDDVNRVQAALDGGGTVLLKAVNATGIPTSFNFGTGLPAGQSGGVYLHKDVTIVGERAHSHQTTILGGFLPIQGLDPVQSTIRGIYFESPIWEAITIGASTGSVITDNVIHNVVPVRVRVPSGRIITFAEGIGFSGYDSSGEAPNLISGHVVVARNTIDGASALFSNGIQFDSFSADAEIDGNIISNVNDDTTETGSGILVIRAWNRVKIIGNVISPGPTQNFGADGIFIGGDLEAQYQVTGNAIQCVSQFADGIDVAGGSANGTTGTIEPRIFANSVEINGVYAYGIFLWDLVTEAQVTANWLKGSGTYALGISTYGFETNIATLNRFIGNDLRNFASNQADLFYDANAQNNTEIGFCRSVIDLGTGNSSTCGAVGAGAQDLAAPNVVMGTATPGQVLSVKQQLLRLQQTHGPIASSEVLR